MSARRIIACVVVALLAGAAANLLVAWACTCIGLPGERWELGHQRIDDRPWFIGAAARPGARQIMSRTMTELEFANLARRSPPVAPPPWSRALEADATGYALEDARGWPLPSFRCTVTGWGGPPPEATGGFVVGRGRPSVALHGNLWTLPYRPLPSGTVVNTVFYAALCFLLLQLRPLVRRCRGRCTGCGYPLRTGPRCPECGRLAGPGPDMA